MHLEVAADNAPAAGLYEAAGFVESGRRPGYYRRGNAPAVEARVLSCSLPLAGADVDSD